MATIPIQPGTNPKPLIEAGKLGDIFQFGVGSWSLAETINVPSGVTIWGIDANNTHITFTLTKANPYAFILPLGASNIEIGFIDFVTNYGLVNLPNGTSNAVVLTDLAVQYATSGDLSNNLGYAIYIYNGQTQNALKILNCKFHDSFNGQRNWVLGNLANSVIDSNLFENVHDGGQLMDSGNNVQFTNNGGTGIQNMGQEIESTSKGYSGFVCKGNVFYDYRLPNTETFGISLVNDYHTGTIVEGNYVEASIQAGSSYAAVSAGQTQRFGIGLEIGGAEAGGTGPTVSANILVGNWVADIAVGAVGATLTNNVYVNPGSAWGGHTVTEPGQGGTGSFTETGAIVNPSVTPSRPSLSNMGPVCQRPSAQPASPPPIVPPPASINTIPLPATLHLLPKASDTGSYDSTADFSKSVKISLHSNGTFTFNS